jgi:hypothetical protein
MFISVLKRSLASLSIDLLFTHFELLKITNKGSSKIFIREMFTLPKGYESYSSEGKVYALTFWKSYSTICFNSVWHFINTKSPLTFCCCRIRSMNLNSFSCNDATWCVVVEFELLSNHQKENEVKQTADIVNVFLGKIQWKSNLNLRLCLQILSILINILWILKSVIFLR